MKHLFPVLFALVLVQVAHAAELQTHVVLAGPAPLASAAEILRRAFTPITAAPYQELQGLPLDQSKESFAVYVPAKKPPDDYALMVYVPPGNEAKIPDGWQDVLDQNGVIFVAADNSGNEAQVRTRRMPLALIAAQNIMRQYPVNPAHVFVAGFSGGARVALRLALAYPDLFTAAILNSGSDPIGTSEIPLPSADLFARFQQDSRIVYVTGNLDQVPYNRDHASAQSLTDLCVANVNMMTMWGKAHETMSAGMLSEVLAALLAPVPQSDSMAACRSNLDAAVKVQLAQVDALIASGDKAGARSLLTGIDAKYGGVAAPQSVALDAELKALGN